MSLFSKNLRFLRKKGNHKQEDISGLFQKRANTVGNWENKKSEPSISELLQLGAYFNVSIQDLLNTDLERQSDRLMPEGQPESNKTDSIRAYAPQDASDTIAREGTHDAFWVILRELRDINERLDKLSMALPHPTNLSATDKSAH